jgi:hypothetical protein
MMISAKTTSHAAYIFAAVWIAVLTVLIGSGVLAGISVGDAVLSGFAIVGCFIPAVGSIFIDKLKAKIL